MVKPRIQASTLLLFSCGGIFIFAFIAAPHSCEWGLASYFWLGFALFLGLLAAPFLLCRERSLGLRFGLSLGYGLAFGAVWVLGMAMSNMQLLCRLF